MNSTFACPAISILKNCVAKTVRVSGNSRNQLLKFGITKSCHELGKLLDNRAYSKLTKNTEELTANNNVRTNRSVKLSAPIGSLKKYSPSVDISEILRKHERQFEEDSEEVKLKKRMSKASNAKKYKYKYQESKALFPENLSDNLNVKKHKYKYQESKVLFPKKLSDDALRMRLHFDKINLNPVENSTQSSKLYNQFISNSKHVEADKHRKLNHSKKMQSKSIPTIQNQKELSKKMQSKSIPTIQNQKELMNMMIADQENYELSLHRSKAMKSLHKQLFNVRDINLTREKNKSQLSEQLKNKQHFARQVVKSPRPIPYKTMSKKKTTEEFKLFKKEMDRKFFRNILFKEDSSKKNTNALLKRTHKFLNKLEPSNTYTPSLKKDRNISTINKNYDIRRSKSVDSSLHGLRSMPVKSDFFDKFQLKQVLGRRSDMITYIKNNNGKPKNFTEKVTAHCDFPASVPDLKHINNLKSIDTQIEKSFNAREKNIDTKNASRILKFGSYEENYHNLEEPQYVLCIKEQENDKQY